MNQSFDPTKPVQTRDGRKARIICTDAKGPYPIVALVWSERQYAEHTAFYTINGYSAPPCHTYDLINVPEHIDVWVNVYRETGRNPQIFLRQYTLKGEADAAAHIRSQGIESSIRIACLRVSFTEGEGL